jgi:antitoxin HicB
MSQDPMTKQYNNTAVFEPAEEGWFVVTFPALPGLITEGDTLEEARAMAIDALRGYLESLTKDGAVPPTKIPSRVCPSSGRP